MFLGGFLLYEPEGHALNELRARRDIDPKNIYYAYWYDIVQGCAELSRVSNRENLDLIVTETALVPEMYACGLNRKDFPQTLISEWERRHWMSYEGSRSMVRRILFIPDKASNSWKEILAKSGKVLELSITIRGCKYPAYLYEGMVSPASIFKLAGRPYRQF